MNIQADVTTKTATTRTEQTSVHQQAMRILNVHGPSRGTQDNN